MVLTKILLPVDFSERCLGAARYAEALAKHFNAEICLLHVLEPVRAQLSTLECGGAVIDNLRESLEAGARNNLRSFLAEELSSARVSRYLVEGDPAAKIVQYAHDERVDLIAMPTHGYGPFRRFILGSVAAKVLHDADCPVWTGVHLEQAPATRPVVFRNVVCAVDLGPQSRKALCWAAQMAREFGARLAAVHAVPSIETHPGEYFDHGLPAELERSAREELMKLFSETSAEGEILIERGDPPKAICRKAAALNADLLVIGRGSAAGLFGRLRTNAYAVIRESPCPVVSV